jgi:hypothetical protein
MESPPGLKLTALSIDDAVKVLSKASGRAISEASFRADLAVGAPVNADGTINIIHYAAWLVKEIANGRDKSPRA